MRSTAFSTALLALAVAGCTLVPPARSPEAPEAPGASQPQPRAQSGALSGNARQCLAALDAAGVRFSPQRDQYFGLGCSMVNAVRVQRMPGDSGDFAVGNLGPVACPAAQALAAWARYGVDRAARRHLGATLVRVETMGSYACRNVGSSGRRSAHARAEAVDVSGFVFADGRRVSVLGDWDGGDADERRFLRAVQASACKRFATVLGPDYNAAHRDHFHLEISGSGTGRRSFCR